MAAAPSPKEEILEPELPICDPHHHLWDFPNSRYFLPELLADVQSGHNVQSTVFVECTSFYRASGPEEMRFIGEPEFVSGVAAMAASGRYGNVLACEGIVSRADLTIGEAVGAVLDAHIRAGNGRFRGIRHAASWDANCGIGSWGGPGGAVSENGRLRHGDRGQGPGDRRRMALMSTILTPRRLRRLQLWCRHRIGGTIENGQPSKPGHNLFEQVQPFPARLRVDDSHTGYVAAGTSEAFDNARGYEITAVETDNRNPGTRIARDSGRQDSVSSEHADIEVHQLRHELRQALLLPVAPPILDCDVLPFDIPKLA